MVSPLSYWIASLLEALSEGFASRVARDRFVAPVTVAAMARVRRSLGRLSALLALFRAGRLPKARARRETASHARVASKAASLPSGRCWLLRLTGDQGEACATALRHLVAEPDVEALLAASPQAGRLLRPLWHMLCLDPMPESLRPPQPATTGPRREAPIDACRGARLDAALARLLGVPPTSTRPPDGGGKLGGGKLKCA